jgi:hypothetical protein
MIEPKTLVGICDEIEDLRNQVAGIVAPRKAQETLDALRAELGVTVIKGDGSSEKK